VNIYFVNFYLWTLCMPILLFFLFFFCMYSLPGIKHVNIFFKKIFLNILSVLFKKFLMFSLHNQMLFENFKKYKKYHFRCLNCFQALSINIFWTGSSAVIRLVQVPLPQKFNAKWNDKSNTSGTGNSLFCLQNCRLHESYSEESFFYMLRAKDDHLFFKEC